MTYTIEFDFVNPHSKYILKIGKSFDDYPLGDGPFYRVQDYLSILTTPLLW